MKSVTMNNGTAYNMRKTFCPRSITHSNIALTWFR